MSKSPRVVIGLVAVWLLAPSSLPLRADRLELLSGEVFNGRVLRVNHQEASIQLSSGGIISFRISGVRSIRKNSEESGESKLVFERPPAKDTLGGPGLPGKVPVPSLGGSRPPKPGEPKPPPLPGTPQSPTKLPEGAVVNSAHGFALVPPQGFVVWPEAQSPSVPLAYRDPFTQTSFTVAAYASTDTLVNLKNSALRAYTQQFKVFHVIRDEAVRSQEGLRGPEAWLIEVQGRLGEVMIHQVQLFARGERAAVVLTYSATAEDYPRFQQAFLKTMESFSFVSGDQLIPSQVIRYPDLPAGGR
jgi:hypothetical protein